MRIKISIFLAITVLLFTSGFFIYQKNYQTLIIDFPANSTGLVVDIYKYDGSEGDKPEEKNIVKSNISNSASLKLKTGGYRIVTRTNASFENFDQAINLGNSPKSVKINGYYSTAKLKLKLTNEKQIIMTAIVAAYSRFSVLYDLSDESLYHNGEWYGALLKYKGDDYLNNDSLLLVAKKENGAWKIITRPPEQFISSRKYPSIPSDVVKDINGKVL